MRLSFSPWYILPFALIQHVHGINFGYEATQLTDEDVRGKPDIQFGNLAAAVKLNPTCKTFPGDSDWPSVARWAAFNATLGGALIRTKPLGTPCYAGPDYNQAACQQALLNSFSSNYLINDPAGVMASWTEGNECPVFNFGNGTCSQGGHPYYVVNATTVRHIQLAVNFARNNNIRLVIKNTGHDFLGKSTGAGSLSIWTHNLKAFEYIPQFSLGDYQGAAARVGTGLQAYDLNREMAARNITIIGPITSTVGAFGGWTLGGGHSTFTSYYGLGADQILSAEIVTADGRFVTADANTNNDLFWAICGGGGSTWGVVTSLVVKSYDETPYSQNTIFFSTGGTSNISTEVFWAGVKAYHAFVPRIVDRGGQGSNYLSNGFDFFNNGTKSVTFQNSIWMPEMSAAELDTFTEPLIRNLAAVGVHIPKPVSALIPNYGASREQGPTNGGAGSGILASRLFPRENFEDEGLLDATMDAIRNYIEAGYSFHSNNYAPTLDVVKNVDNAVSPHLRRAVSHATGFNTGGFGPQTEEQVKASYDIWNSYIQQWRDVSPTAGCYMNEANVMEPNWQWAFFGENYPRLMRIKKQWDPWGLFYATTAVGSEEWEVRNPGPLKTQDGRLCRLATPSSSWSEPDVGDWKKKVKSSDALKPAKVVRPAPIRRAL